MYRISSCCQNHSRQPAPPAYGFWIYTAKGNDMNFEFTTAQQIIFGAQKIKMLPAIVKNLGTRPAFITGSSAERIAPIFRMLKGADLTPAAFSITEEPTTARISMIAQQARDLGCDCVVAFGGGSVIDAGKAVAALLTNTRPLMDYLEVIGQGLPLTEIPAPCIAIPTTAGTGAEATRNAVLCSTEHHVKASMRHAQMLPNVALIDPELTLSTPPSITASTGLDAFTQLLEAFVSIKSNPLTDALCREGLKQAALFLEDAYTNGSNLEARTGMALASLFSGMALANAGLGAVHGFAGPIGGMFSASHGMVCASLLTAATETNIQALKERDPAGPALKKYAEAAAIVTGNTQATLDDLTNWIQNLCYKLEVPGLSALGIDESASASILEKAQKASSMKGNPIALTQEELEQILVRSLPAQT